jgi:putative glutathione S-transferase
VVVREARPEEYPAIADLLLEAYTATFDITDWYRQNLLNVADHALTHEWWVAADGGGRLLGAVRIPRDARPGTDRATRTATFGTLGVLPSARGRGVARALVGHLVDRFRREGFDELAIWSGPQMIGAHRLYEKLGFVRRLEGETRVVDGGQRLLSYVLPLTADEHAPGFAGSINP